MRPWRENINNDTNTSGEPCFNFTIKEHYQKSQSMPSGNQFLQILPCYNLR